MLSLRTLFYLYVLDSTSYIPEHPILILTESIIYIEFLNPQFISLKPTYIPEPTISLNLLYIP